MNEKQKLALTAGLFALGVVGLCVLLYFQLAKIGWGPFKGPDSLETKIDQQEKKLAAAQARVAQIDPKKEELEQLKKDEESASQLLPTESTPDVLLHYISQKAEDSGCDLISIKPTKIEAQRARAQPMWGRPAAGGGGGQKYEEWNYAIDLVGSYDQLGAFINKMEEFEISYEGGKIMRRFFAVKNLGIAGAEQGFTEFGRHECSLVMQTFRYTGAEAGAAAAGARR